MRLGHSGETNCRPLGENSDKTVNQEARTDKSADFRDMASRFCPNNQVLKLQVSALGPFLYTKGLDHPCGYTLYIKSASFKSRSGCWHQSRSPFDCWSLETMIT